MVLTIRTGGDPVLRRVARPVDRVTEQIARLARDMLDTMYEAKGVGLAAPQVGESLRLIVVDAGEGPHILVNPRVVGAQGDEEDEEGCLSLPGVRGVVSRAQKVTVRGRGMDGKQVTLRADGLLARVLQHEIDHLDGVLFIDKASEVYVLKPPEAEERAATTPVRGSGGGGPC